MTHSVRLIGITKPVIDDVPDTASLLAFCARVSSTANQLNHDTGPKLLRSLIKRQEWSPLEMVSLTIEIVTTRDIARQILRHRSFSFQEFCVAGSTEVTFDMPGALKKGRRQSYKRTIEKLYTMQQAGRTLPSMVRVFDEATRTFTNAAIREVFQTGIKPTFRITLENGRTIECTKEHRFLTADGFLPLEDAIGLRMIGSKAVMERPDTMLACNGVAAYRDEDWMRYAKQRAIEDGTGLTGIADAAHTTVHTIRKWLKQFGLQFTKKEVASYTSAWNKGVRGYKLGPHSSDTIRKMRESSRKGPDSNLWRGGVKRSERLRIADWCARNRTEFLRAANYECNRCRGNLNLELHHIETVAERPDLAYEPTNIEVICKECHREHHNLNGEHKMWRERSRGNTLTIHWSKVRHVEFIGDQMTYDLEVEHDSHNFVGNGIVVHNSQRYAVVDAPPVLREARLQDHKDRQNSIEMDDDALPQYLWAEHQRRANVAAQSAYQWALTNGIAKEVARAVLPEGLTESRLYMAGSLRSWTHYVMLRNDVKTQKEHRLIAADVAAILADQFPDLAEFLLGDVA